MKKFKDYKVYIPVKAGSSTALNPEDVKLLKEVSKKTGWSIRRLIGYWTKQGLNEAKSGQLKISFWSNDVK